MEKEAERFECEEWNDSRWFVEALKSFAREKIIRQHFGSLTFLAYLRAVLRLSAGLLLVLLFVVLYKFCDAFAGAF